MSAVEATTEADEKDMVVGILALRDDEELTPEKFNSLLSIVKNSTDSSTLARLSFQAIEKCCNRDSTLIHESVNTLSELMQRTEDRTTKITAAQSIKRICRLVESGEIDLLTKISDILAEMVTTNSADALICRPLQDALSCFKQNKQVTNLNEEQSTTTVAPIADVFTAQQHDTLPLEEVTPECLMILSEIKPSRWKDIQRRMQKFFIADVTSSMTIQRNMMLSIPQMSKWEEFAGVKSEEVPTIPYSRILFDRLVLALNFLADEKFWMREGFTFEKDVLPASEKTSHRVVQSSSDYSKQRDSGRGSSVDTSGRIVQRSDSYNQWTDNNNTTTNNNNYQYEKVPYSSRDRDRAGSENYDPIRSNNGYNGSSVRDRDHDTNNSNYPRPILRGDSRDRGLKSSYEVANNYYVDEDLYRRGGDRGGRGDDPYYIDRVGYLPETRRSSRSRSPPPPPQYPPYASSTSITASSSRYEADDGATAFLFLRNLPIDIRVEEIVILCKRSGLTSIDERDVIMPPPKSPLAMKRGKQQKLTSYVHAYINFRSVEEARLIRNEFNGMMLHGYRIEVDYSLGKPSPYIRITGIRNLSAGIIERFIADHASPISIAVKRSKRTGELYAGVLFASSGDATKVVKETCRNGGAVIQIDGIPVRLEYALAADDEGDVEEFPETTGTGRSTTTASRYSTDVYPTPPPDYYRGRGRDEIAYPSRGIGRSRERDVLGVERRDSREYTTGRTEEYRYEAPPSYSLPRDGGSGSGSGSGYYDNYRYHSRSRSGDRSRNFNNRAYDIPEGVRRGGSSRDRRDMSPAGYVNKNYRQDSRDRNLRGGSYKAPLPPPPSTAAAAASRQPPLPKPYAGSTSNAYNRSSTTGPKTAMAIVYSTATNESVTNTNQSTLNKRSVSEIEDDNQSNKKSKWSVNYSYDIDAIEETDIIAGDGNIVDTQEYQTMDAGGQAEGQDGGSTADYYYDNEGGNTGTYNSEEYQQQQQQYDSNLYQVGNGGETVGDNSDEPQQQQLYAQVDDQNISTGYVDSSSQLKAYYQEIGSSGGEEQGNDIQYAQDPSQNVTIDYNGTTVDYQYQEEVYDYEAEEEDYLTAATGESMLTSVAATMSGGDNSSTLDSTTFDSQQVLQSYDSDYSITTANTIPGSDWTDTTTDTPQTQQQPLEQQSHQGTSYTYPLAVSARDYTSTKSYETPTVNSTTSKFTSNSTTALPSESSSAQRTYTSYQNQQTYRPQQQQQQQQSRQQQPAPSQQQQPPPRQQREYTQRDHSATRSTDQPVSNSRANRDYNSSNNRDYNNNSSSNNNNNNNNNNNRYVNPYTRNTSNTSNSITSYSQQSRPGDRELSSGKQSSQPQNRNNYYTPSSSSSSSGASTRPGTTGPEPSQTASRSYYDNRSLSYTNSSTTSTANRGGGGGGINNNNSSNNNSYTSSSNTPIDLSSNNYYKRPSNGVTTPSNANNTTGPVRTSKFTDANAPSSYTNAVTTGGSSQSYQDSSQYYRPPAQQQPQQQQQQQQLQSSQLHLNPSAAPIHQSSYSAAVPSHSSMPSSGTSYTAMNSATNYSNRNPVTTTNNYNYNHTSTNSNIPSAVQMNNPYMANPSSTTPTATNYPVNNYSYHTSQLGGPGVVPSSVTINNGTAANVTGGHLIKKGF